MKLRDAQHRFCHGLHNRALGKSNVQGDLNSHLEAVLIVSLSSHLFVELKN